MAFYRFPEESYFLRSLLAFFLLVLTHLTRDQQTAKTPAFIAVLTLMMMIN